jgi:inward rectifier potassium channel
MVIGGVAHARDGSFLDAFFFSVQTIGTIGYGAMYPESTAAEAMVVLESTVGLILTALATGMVFAKFSRSTARIVFTEKAVISPMNGVPTLQVRIGNERGNRIIDAVIRASISRTERTAEGAIFYRNIDLDLVRERLFSLSRSWSILHVINEKSPLYGGTPESFVAQELELNLLVIGIDDISMQTVQATHQYFNQQIIWGARLADILSETPDGSALILDLRKFNDIEPTKPTPDFPYPKS